MKQFERYLRNTPPSCLRGFKLKKGKFARDYGDEADTTSSVWQIACRCGSSEGKFLGHPLKDYDDEYDDPDFISPLKFECNKCKAITPILDTDKHGYHADLDRREGEDDGGSCKIRGKGKPKEYVCPDCGKNIFKIKAGFVFWNLSELEESFEDRWEDLFMVFICKCKCVGCGEVVEPTDFGKL
ncbi:hypothetical protein K2Y11_10115 [bacterium]|nr:hypothetical protein [bacterium]